MVEQSLDAVAFDEPVKRTVSQIAHSFEGLARLQLSGPLTAATAPVLRRGVREAVERGHDRLVVDLQAVSGLDAAGLAALLDAHRFLRARTGGTLVLRANALVCGALKKTGTIAVFALSHGSGM